MDRRKAYLLDPNCGRYHELEIIAFKCRVCKKKCDLGEVIVKAVDRVELGKLRRYRESLETDG